jgi:long-subunit fatty acid transport protein
MRVIESRSGRCAALVALGLSLAPAAALANPEPGLYDARTLGMAGAGIAFLDNPAAVFHNPANLEGVRGWAGTLSIAGIVAVMSAPLDGPGAERSTGPAAAPTFLLAGASRVLPRVVVGAGAYISTGYGGAYSNVDSIQGTPLFDPDDQRAALLVGELAVPASLRVTDGLDVGLSVRLPYARQSVRVHQELTRDNYRPVGQTVTGFGGPGVLAGVTYRPHPSLALSAAYRSKVRIGMRGITAVWFTGADPFEVETETEWFVPHMLRAGVAGSLRDGRLLVTAEVRAQLHADANVEQVFRQDFDGFEEIRVPLEWKDVYNGLAAVEYRVSPRYAVRGGVSAGNSATRREAAHFFTPPPGLLASFGVGGGARYAHHDVDLGLGLALGEDEIGPQPGRCQPGDLVKVGCPGRYQVRSVMLGVSVTRRR